MYEGIAQLLADAGVGVYRSDGSPFVAGETAVTVLVVPAFPERVVCVTTYPGVEDDDWNGWRYPRMQVRVRGTRADTRDALALDEAAYQALQAAGPTSIGSGWRLVDCHAIQSSPQPIGQNDAGSWELTRNYQLSIEQET